MAVVQSQSPACLSLVTQAAAIAPPDGLQDVLAARRASFAARRSLVMDALNAIPGVTCRRP